jgi:hypothetical protein
MARSGGIEESILLRGKERVYLNTVRHLKTPASHP